MQQLLQLFGKVQLQTSTPAAQHQSVEARPVRRTKTTYRLRKIHESFDEEPLRDALCIYFSIEKDEVTVNSLAYDAPYGRSSRQKVATVTFKVIPELLKTGNRWSAKLPLPGRSKELHNVCFDTTFEGFTPLTPAELEDGTSTDCIFIHGWAGHSIGSFSSPDGDWLWPRDGLCHEIPTLRVWLYGYSSDLRDSGSIEDVYEYADTFRRALVDARRHPDSKVASRPLIFMVHSLGGWILQDAVIRMAVGNSPDDKMNLDMVKGALLFGVPNLGMDNQEIIGLLQEDDLPAVYTASLLDERSGFRQRMKQTDDFHDACSKRDAIMYAFYETEKTPKVCRDKETQRWIRNGPAVLLVSQSSATYGRFEHQNKIPWKSNHNNMLKFRRGDMQYETVLSRLHEILQSIENPQAAHETLLSELSGDQKACLQSLAFPEMNYRRNDIGAPAEGTCAWLSQNPTYQKWLAESGSILWIKGHPGTGKSTIVSHALDLFSALPDDSVILSYFFNGRGIDIQRNLSGMYRSLLHQLLSCNLPQLSNLTSTYVTRNDTRGLIGKAWNWQEKELQDEFQKFALEIAQKRKLRIYVDALDEAGEQNARKFLHLLKFLVSRDQITPHMAVCFSSRHYPSISFNSTLEIRVEQENEDDIRTYIESKFSTNELDKSMTEVRQAILDKADRSFQWATIVVDRIIDLNEQGHNSSFLLEAVSTTPQDLTELYRHLLTQITGDEDRVLALRLFQWLVFAERPLTLTEMRLALVLKEEVTSFQSCVSSKFYPCDDRAMHRRLRTLSAGLAECRAGDASHDGWYKDHYSTLLPASKVHDVNNTAQLIHQSVLDFLMKEGLAFLGCQLLPDVTTTSQLLLARLCFFRVLMTTDTRFISHRAWREMSTDELPDASSFDEQFKRENGVDMHEWLRNQHRTPFDPELTTSSATGSDSESNLSSDIESDPESESSSPQQSDWESDPISGTSSNAELYTESEMDSESDSGYALYSLSSSRNDRGLLEWMMVHRWELYMAQHFPFLEYCLTYAQSHLKTIDTNHSTDRVQEEIIPLLHGEHSLLSAWLKVDESTLKVHQFGPSCTMLHLAAKWGIKFLLTASMENQLDVNAVDTCFGDTPLCMAAATEGDSHITKMLLRQESIDVNVPDKFGNTPLSKSFHSHQFEVVRILLVRDDINVRKIDQYDCSALCSAVSEASPCDYETSTSELEFPEIGEIIEMLLQRDDININSKDSRGWTALMYASTRSTETIVQRLLDHGAQVNDQNNEGKTALHLAAVDDRSQIVELLLSYGADSNLKTITRQTAMHMAAAVECSLDTLRLLLNDTNVDAQDHDGLTALHYAAEQEGLQIMELLLNAKADTTIQTYDTGDTAAHVAIFWRRLEALKLLLENGANPSAVNHEGRTLLHNAAESGILQGVELLLDAKADITIQDPVDGETAAHYAISSGRPAVLALLLQRGIDPNAMDNEDSTLLHYAANAGDLRSIELLLLAEADTTLQDVYSVTAFLAAGKALCKKLGLNASGKGAVSKVLYSMDNDETDSKEHQKGVLLTILNQCIEEAPVGKDASKKKVENDEKDTGKKGRRGITIRRRRKGTKARRFR